MENYIYLKYITIYYVSQLKFCFNFRFYEATLEELGNSSVKVKFDGYTTLESVSIIDIKPLGLGTKRPLSGDESK